MLIAQSRPTLCDLMDCSLPGSSVHGILQATVLEIPRAAEQLSLCPPTMESVHCSKRFHATTKIPYATTKA